MEVTKTYIVQYLGNMHPLYECSVKGEGVRYYLPKLYMNGDASTGLDEVSWEIAKRYIDKTLEAIACGSDGA